MGVPKSWVATDKLEADDLNGNFEYLNTNKIDLNAGETIAGATLPVAIYQNTSDNELYACDGNDLTKLQFLAFAISNSTDGNPIIIQTSGIVKGFTGLVEGSKYYVQDDKTIGLAKGTYPIYVGRAISETELLIEKNHPTKTIASDSLQNSNDTEKTTTQTSYTKLKETLVNGYFKQIRVKFDLNTTSGGFTAFGRVYKNGVEIGTEQTNNSNPGVYATKSEDITINAVPNDLIQIYVKGSTGETAKVKNFRIYFDLAIDLLPSNNESYTNQDP